MASPGFAGIRSVTASAFDDVLIGGDDDFLDGQGTTTS
jgi:hypothetical protein